MNRIRDYTGFAIEFCGLGYIVLWPVTALDVSGKPFGASLFCRDTPHGVLDLLCNSAHPLQLPSNLHALGFLSAMFVAARLLLYAIRRSRRAVDRRAADMSALTTQSPGAMAPPRQRPARPSRPVKPRTHFGLRGMPR
jgi:hypothetical protein